MSEITNTRELVLALLGRVDGLERELSEARDEIDKLHADLLLYRTIGPQPRITKPEGIDKLNPKELYGRQLEDETGPQGHQDR